jgi:hypothetical protein
VTTTSEPETRERRRDHFTEAWERLIDAEGYGPSRLHAFVIIDPECGDGECSYFNPIVGACRLFEFGVPWRRGACSARSPRPAS